MALTFGFLGLALSHHEGFSPTNGVMQSSSKLSVALAKIVLGLGIHKELLSHTLWVWACAWSDGLPVCRGSRGRWVAADEDGQHLAIPDARILERLCLVGDGLAVEVDAL